MSDIKHCGTCEHWSQIDQSPYSPYNRKCMWPAPDMPFWAMDIEGDDYRDYTSASEGNHCRTWKARK